MKVDTFWEYIESLREVSSGNKKKDIIRSIIEDNSEGEEWSPAISFIAGQEFSDVGVAPKTVMNAINESNLPYTDEEISDLKYEQGTVTEALLQEFPFESEGHTQSSENMVLDEFFEEDGKNESGRSFEDLSRLYSDCLKLHDLSGNALQSKLATMFTEYYPPAVSFGVLGDLSIGASKKTITMAVAEDEYTRDQIERARSFTPDAVEFVRKIQSGDGLQLKPTVGEPFEPMLAKNKDRPDDVSEWVSQLKLDGHRLLLHINDGEYTAYTRVMNDVTHSLPELDEIDWPEGEYIFDCEAVAYSESQGDLPFSKTSQRIGRKHNIGEFDYQIKFYLFTLIMDDGEDISTLSQEERFNRLLEVSPTEENLVEVIDVNENINEGIQKSKEEGYEGVIIKDSTAEYKFGKRSNSWRKIKNTEETIDLRVVDFERRQGSETNTLGNIGVETSDGHFVGYVGTGFDDELAKEIWENQDEYMGKVVEIQFEGFDEKLRFPSFKYFREDGEPDSLEKVKNLATEV